MEIIQHLPPPPPAVLLLHDWHVRLFKSRKLSICLLLIFCCCCCSFLLVVSFSFLTDHLYALGHNSRHQRHLTIVAAASEEAIAPSAHYDGRALACSLVRLIM